MNNKFLKHFLVIGSGTFISMIIGFLTAPIITRMVSPIEYGQYSIFTMYANMALMVLCLGLDQSLVRFFYEKETDQYRRELLFKCLKYPLVITFLLIIIICILSVFGWFEFELGSLLLSLLCVYTMIQVIYRFSLLLIRLQYKSKLYSILGILQKSVYVILVLAFIYIGVFSDVISLAIATILSTLVCMIISIVAEKQLWNIREIKKDECKITKNELLRYAYPYIFSMGVTTLFQCIDKISLNYYCSYEEVGIYSSTMTLVHVFSIVQTTFNILWAPMAIEHYTKNKEDVSFYQQGNQIITVIMFFMGFSLILCKDIFSLLLGAEYREAAYILPFLIFNPIMYTISETTVNGLVFMKKSNMQVLVSIGACVTNIIGNILLVPQLGCRGAAISTGISYIVFFTLRTVLSNRYFYVDFRLKKFYFITAIAIIYSFYNTFVKFNIWSIVGYCVCLFLLVIMYLDTVKFGIMYMKNLIFDMLQKKSIK